MRIHSNVLTMTNIYTAARFARADIVALTEHGSRSRDRAFNVKLEGESRRRPNGGSSGAAHGSGYAATWDQWGVFLSILFDIDPDMVTPYYRDREDFHARTGDRFAAPALGFGVAPGTHYWPRDAHGDHRFQFSGTIGQQECTKCSAVQRWSV